MPFKSPPRLLSLLRALPGEASRAQEEEEQLGVSKVDVVVGATGEEAVVKGERSFPAGQCRS